MSSKNSPNYALVAGLGLLGGGIGGAVAHFALKVGTPETAIAAVVGFLVLSSAGLLRAGASDTKRMATLQLVKRNTDKAYEAQSMSRYDVAEKLLLEATSRGQELGAGDLSLLAATHSLGNLYRLQNKPEQAEASYRQAIAGYESAGQQNSIHFAHCLRDCAAVLEVREKRDASTEMAQRALKILEAQNQTGDLASTYSIIARNQQATGNMAGAVETWARVKQLQGQNEVEGSTEVIATSLTLAACQRAQNDLSGALDSYKDALIRVSKAARPPRQLEAEALLEMAEVRQQQGASKDVEPLALSSLKILQTYVGPREKLLTRLAAVVGAARASLGQTFDSKDLLWIFTQNRDAARDLFRAEPALVGLRDRTGWGVVQWALFRGWEDLTRWLMRNEGPVSGFDAAVMSPVHVAAAWSKGGTITALADAGLELDSVGPNGWTPIHFAAYQGRQDCFDQLQTRGADAKRLDVNGRNTLHHVAEGGHNGMVPGLLGIGVDKNAAESKNNRTPLHLAALAGHGAVVRTLLMNGADENAQDKDGRTPIQLCEAAGHKGLTSAMKHFREAMGE